MPTHESAVIVGAGPIGLACAIAARRRGVDPLVIDAGPIASSIVRYAVGMVFFTTPERLEIGDHPMVCSGAKPTREEALMYYRGVARAERLRIRTYTRLESAARGDRGVDCRVLTRLGADVVTTDRLVLATGYLEHPNRLGIPGEQLPHVSHYPDEAHLLVGLDVIIVGGKNSAIELALNAYRAGARVTVVHRGAELKASVKYWLKPDFENRVKAGEIAVRWQANVTEISEAAVTIRLANGTIEALPADRVYLLTGYHPDFELFERIGIRLEAGTGRPEHDPETLETNVPGVYLAGSVTAGRFISEVFIENGKYDGEKIFGDPVSRGQADAAIQGINRPVGE
ncbi:MAG: YpdA family putative bacillithiol disulfide reductase [Gemmatimonadota bacterium]